MHPPVLEWVQHCIEQEGPFDSVIEIGSRDVNGSVRPLFPALGRFDYIGLDLRAGPGVDWVGDARRYEPERPVQCVVCTEVLEHEADAQLLIGQSATWLTVNGTLIVTAATDPRAPHSAIDEDPIRPEEFYRNVSRAQLEQWLREAGFAMYVVNIEGADIRAVASRSRLRGDWVGYAP